MGPDGTKAGEMTEKEGTTLLRRICLVERYDVFRAMIYVERDMTENERCTRVAVVGGKKPFRP
jgi:hypothetical protein